MTTLVAYDPQAWATWRTLALGYVEALSAVGRRPVPDEATRTEMVLGAIAETGELDLDSTTVRLDLVQMALLTGDGEQAWPPASATGTPGPGGWVDAAELEKVSALMDDLRELNDRLTDPDAGPLTESWAALQDARDALAGPRVDAGEPDVPAAPEEFATWWAALGTSSALMAGWNATSFIEIGHGKPWEPVLDLRLRSDAEIIRVTSDLQSYQFADFARLMNGSTLGSVLVGLQRCIDAAAGWAERRTPDGLAAKAHQFGSDIAWWVGADPAFADLAPVVWSLLRQHSTLQVTLGPDATWTVSGPVEESGRTLADLRATLTRAWWICRT
jgi:hypothetical protein